MVIVPTHTCRTRGILHRLFHKNRADRAINLCFYLMFSIWTSLYRRLLGLYDKRAIGYEKMSEKTIAAMSTWGQNYLCHGMSVHLRPYSLYKRSRTIATITEQYHNNLHTKMQHDIYDNNDDDTVSFSCIESTLSSGYIGAVSHCRRLQACGELGGNLLKTHEKKFVA